MKKIILNLSLFLLISELSWAISSEVALYGTLSQKFNHLKSHPWDSRAGYEGYVPPPPLHFLCVGTYRVYYNESFSWTLNFTSYSKDGSFHYESVDAFDKIPAPGDIGWGHRLPLPHEVIYSLFKDLFYNPITKSRTEFALKSAMDNLVNRDVKPLLCNVAQKQVIMTLPNANMEGFKPLN